MREGRTEAKRPTEALLGRLSLDIQGVFMRRALVLVSAALLFMFGAALAQQKETPQEGAPAPIAADDAAKKNPVKATPEGLAEAKKLFGYHCAMCHG